MNDKIKVILDRFEKINVNNLYPFEMEASDCKKLLDYITNLQQENERLKEENNNKAMNDYAHAIDESWYRELYEDYKSRCEKASDKLGNYKHYSTPTEKQNSENEDIVDSALNILQNGSEDNE